MNPIVKAGLKFALEFLLSHVGDIENGIHDAAGKDAVKAAAQALSELLPKLN